MIKRTGALSDRVKVRLEDKRAREDRHQAMLIQGFKSFGVLNGAGVIAMLGFIQALVGSGEFAEFRPFALLSLGLFMFGAFAAAGIFLTLTLILNTKNSTKSDQWVTVVALTAQVTCALGGAYFCILGIYRAF